MEFKYSMQCIIIRNSIESSKTGNCTNFDNALYESTGFVNFSLRQEKKSPTVTLVLNNDDKDTLLAESTLIQSDIESPNVLKDNILYYIAGFIVNKLLTKLECLNCRSELLLDPDDRCVFQMPAYLAYSKFGRV